MIFTSILTLITAKALPYLNRNIPSIYYTRITAIIFLYAGLLSINSYYIESIGSGIGIYSGLFQITQVNILLESFLLIIGGLILISWPNENTYFYNKGLISKCSDYSLIVLFSSLGSILLLSSFDLISLYLSIELQSFGLYVLATLYRDSEESTKAGLKYFLLGGLSSCIILLGCGIIYSYTGITNFESIYSILSTSHCLNFNPDLEMNFIQGLNLGLILMFIGFLFKIAAAPLHNWSPDVYDEVPTIVTTWLTIIPKLSIIILLLELQFYGLSLISLDIILGSHTIKILLLVSSVLSLLIGTFVGLAQTRIKRLLAYSTISHIGFILLALAINTESSIDSLLFYIIQYTITNLNLFLIILALSYISINTINSYNNNIITDIRDIRFIKECYGKYLINPGLTVSLAICLFSMAGIPPLIGFFSKFFVLYSALLNGYYFISLIAIAVSVISASYYIKIVKVIYSDNLSENDSNSRTINSTSEEYKPIEFYSTIEYNRNSILTNLHSYLISVLTLSILLFIFKPSLILNSTQVLSLSLFYW
jgi:NADH-ubiquinone oxidoreductase chain 2